MTSKMIESPSRRNAMGILAAAALSGCATQSVTPAEPEAVADARTTLSNSIRDPDQTWIRTTSSRERLLIAPQLVRAGFIFGGSGGRGVLVARDGRRGQVRRSITWRRSASASRPASTCPRPSSS